VDIALLVLDEVIGPDSYRSAPRRRRRRLEAGAAALIVRGADTGDVTAERTMLNWCVTCRPSDDDAAWVDAVEGTKAKIRDTRKTLPGLRALQKYVCAPAGRSTIGWPWRCRADQGQPRGRGRWWWRAARRPCRRAELECEVEVDSLEQSTRC